MKRVRQPFFRPSRKTWFVQIDGKQINLGPDEDAAWTRYHELMALRCEHESAGKKKGSGGKKIGNAHLKWAFSEAACIIRSHHECWDGSGYPDGLKGEAIPRLARVVAVADNLDNRIQESGQPARSFEEGLALVRAEAGHKFDPAIVAAVPPTLAASAARSPAR